MVVDPVILRFRDALRALYGDRIKRIVLYGSRARGDARPASDYDVAVFLDRPFEFAAESPRLAKIEAEILENTGALINTLPFEKSRWLDRSFLMQELRSEGVEL